MLGKIENNKIIFPPINDGNMLNVYKNKEWLDTHGFHELTDEELNAVELYEKTIIKEKIIASINKKCDDAILNDFKWRDNEFYLSMENQMNFANMFMAKDYLTYPQTVKTKTGYIELVNAEEVSEFYFAGVNFVKEKLAECWKEKQKIELKND